MTTLNRRQFLKGSLATAATVGLSARSWSNVAGANSEIRMAVIGFNGQGEGHINSILKLEGARLVALCDVDSDVLRKQQERLTKGGTTVRTFTDIRHLLEYEGLDAVSIATPNHWHALATLWSLQAGKDVYVEKPVSHNVSEGRRMVEAARKYKKIVQTGTQTRSSEGIREAVAWVQAGNLGKIKVARGLCYKARQSIGKVAAAQPVPSSVDYDLWCGPAPKRPLMRQKLHYDWHWDFVTGNGDLGNQGIHQMDIARWFLGVNELSPRVFSIGTRAGYVDDGNTPNSQFVFHDYPKAPLIFEVRGLPSGKDFHDGELWRKNMDKFLGASVGVVIHCEHGHVLVPDYGKAIVYDAEGKEIKRFDGASGHHANFLKAVHSRKVSDLNADILEGHLSSALCHTGNISYQLGKKATPGEIRETLNGDKEALETFERLSHHLGANGVDIYHEPLTLGQVLRMNPRTEKFRGNRAANLLLTREYRAGFEVPSKV